MAKKVKSLAVVPPAVTSPATLVTPEPILTPQQVATRLQLPSSATVYEMTRRRASGRRPMPFFKVGKFLRFKWSEIERWLEESRKAA
jgi:excisionase family DNA binding protein